MNAVLETMLSKYPLSDAEEYLRALREVMQRLTLLALWRSRFFERAAFYGGTALRIFHGLPRYSEDMDFSLLLPQPQFSLEGYAAPIASELSSYGFEVSAARKAKPDTRKVESAFLKANTLRSMLLIEAPRNITSRLHRDARIKIKVEVDTDPPPGAGYDMESAVLPIPHHVRLYDKPSLFAGKLHALLCRGWRSRLKGRDFYDFIWFVGMDVPCSLPHLRARMVQSGNLDEGAELSLPRLHELLRERFSTVRIEDAARDVTGFVTDPQAVDLWSTDLFLSLVEKVKADGAAQL